MLSKESVSKTKLYATSSLKRGRELKGYTQQEVVDVITLTTEESLSFSAYSKIEQGVLPMSAQIALELARLLRVDIKDMVERK